MIQNVGFEDSIRSLEDFYRQPLVPAARAGLRRAAVLLDRLGNPHRCFRSIHVTGSTGKGSTTSMIGSILEQAGFRTGYFRSPHLESYRERIAVNGADITSDEWVRLFSRVWPVVEAMHSCTLDDYQLGRPALFEVLFALMSLQFADKGVEWAAVEAGLGGRLDATNLLQSDVAVITNVSLEHTQVLGDTIGAIAAEKAAIIKPDGRAVTAAADPVALEVIETRASELGVPLLKIGQDIQVRVTRDSLVGQDLTFTYGDRPLDVQLHVAGAFQATNAATAFGACRALRYAGIEVGDDTVTRGLEAAVLPGRFEIVSHHPLIILDGAHNPAAARALRSAVEHLLPNLQKTVVFAAMADKDLVGIAKELGPVADRLILTRVPDAHRAASIEMLLGAFGPYTGRLSTQEAPEQALNRALNEMDASSALIVTGSMYLVGYARRLLMEAAVA
jgi:dihydrofolate synthase / folylpolyglutamate synthase